MGFLNCREWERGWLREVEIMCVLKRKSLDVLGVAEMFLQQEEEADVPGYVWYGHNRVRGKCASGEVGLLIKKNIRSKLLLRIEGAVWVELQAAEGNNMIVGIGVRVQESEMLFEMMKAKVTDYQEADFAVLVVGNFNAHIGGQSSHLTGMLGSCWVWWEYVIYVRESVITLSRFSGRWTWEMKERRSEVDYTLLMDRVMVEDTGELNLASDHNLIW